MFIRTFKKANMIDVSTVPSKQAKRGVALEDKRSSVHQLQSIDPAQPPPGQILQRAIGDNGDQKWVMQKSTGERFWAVRNTIGSYDLYQNMTFIMDAWPNDNDFEILGESSFDISPGLTGLTGGDKAPRRKVIRRKRPRPKSESEPELEEPGLRKSQKKRGRKEKESSKKKSKKEIELDFRDSLLDDTSDSDVSEVEETGLHEDRPLSSGATTIRIGTKKIGGSELMTIAQEAVDEVISTVAGDELPQFDEELGSRVVVGGSDWLKGLGTMSKMISGKQRRPLHKGAIFNSMEHPIAPRTGKQIGSLSVGLDQSRITFKLQNKLVRVSPEGQKDFEYEDLIKKLDELRDDFSVTDSDIALALLQLVRTGRIDESSPLAGNSDAIHLLNFTNTLGIGVEGSQLNTNSFHYVTILEDVFSNLLTLKDAFFNGPFGGAIPMATVRAKNKEGQIATRRQGLIDSQRRGTQSKPRGDLKMWQKDSVRRKGRVSSMRAMRGSQSSHPVLLKEALNLANIGRRLIIAENINDKATFITVFKRYIKGTMLENFGDSKHLLDTPTLWLQRSQDQQVIPPVKVGSMEEAQNRSWNAGDRFELEGDNSRYFVLLRDHFGGLEFQKGDIWIKLRGG